MAKSVKHINKTPTEGLLKQSLLSLIQTKPLRAITIKELCTNASINRTTFYAHYSSADEVLEEIQTELFDDLIKIVRTVSHGGYHAQEATTLLLSEIQRNKETYHILFSSSDCMSFIQRFATLLHTNISTMSMPYSNDANYKYYPIYMTNGIVACITQWVAADCDTPPEEFSELLLTITHNSNISK